MSLPLNTTAQQFAEYIAEHKPYLIEIEEEIQNFCRNESEGKIKLELHIRGKNVVIVDFWKNRRWKRAKLT
jgi:hypothetical protein